MAIDPNFMLQQAADGTAGTYLEAITALIAQVNLNGGTDANNTIQAIVAPGAIDPTKRLVTLSVDGTDAYTLADGTFLGQSVLVVVIAGANTPVGTVTPATRAPSYANITALGALGDQVRFTWVLSGSTPGWMWSDAIGVTITP